MQITAHLNNSGKTHDATVTTSGVAKRVAIPARVGGTGSSVNGGELLMLALATCYCNDLYREAARLRLEITAVEVEATAAFEGVGLAASAIRYKTRITSNASPAQIDRLMRETDAVAEVHNTVRAGVEVRLVPWHV